MSTLYTRRAYGCAIVKSINSNFNADFSHQPRTLPDGTVYATDKALKFTVRNYLQSQYPELNTLYFKRLNKDYNPYDLPEAYEAMYKSKVKEDGKDKILKNLLSSVDVRLFGATFAPKGAGIDKKNISIHGPLQITHGINRFPRNDIYSEQIMSPFRNTGEEGDAEKGAATLGSQSKLREGHYVFHFSLNPRNIAEHLQRLDGGGTALSEDDINKVKEAMRRGATFYDSASKAGSENELLLWVELEESSKAVLPSFIDLVKVAEDGAIDLSEVSQFLASEHLQGEIKAVELYYNAGTSVVGIPQNSKTFNL